MNTITKTVLVTALLITALLFAGCGQDESAQTTGSGGDTDAEPVIVVGSGLAGHAAAYGALAEGEQVIWIEKNEELGGSAVIATGTYSAAETRLQEEKGIEDSVELFIEDVNRIGKGRADQDLLALYATKATEVWEWFVDHGLEPSERSPFIDPVHSPYSVPRTYTPEKNSAFEFCRILQQEMQPYRDNTTVLKSTEVTSLIVEDDRVMGVVADGPDGTSEYRGRAVILATGGFGSNFELIARRMPKYEELRSVTMPHAQGDGILMAEEVGAKLVNMDYLVAYFGAIAEEDTKRASFGTLTSGFAEGWKGDVWVDLNGNRFIDEDDDDEDPRETALDEIPEQTTIIVFDSAAIERNGGVPIRDFENWVEQDFGVKKADSIEELAAEFDLPVDSFVATIEQVNRNAETGVDPDFGKEENYPVSEPPYYGVKAYGTIFMTQGGVKTNTRMQVISRETDEPIPGLYAAGEVQGTAQWGGFGYAGGSGNTPPLVFGMEAGRFAAGEQIGL
ncbi:MAG: FAD-dependent oxidoreductase [Spirochaetota bacterium]